MKLTFVLALVGSLLLCSCGSKETETDSDKCGVHITNSLVGLREKTEVLEDEFVQVPNGWYKVLAKENVKTAFNTTERWIKIQVKSDTGWIQDNTWAIAEKKECQ